MELSGGPADSQVVRCAFFAGSADDDDDDDDDDDAPQFAEETEELEELTTHWRNVPPQSFGVPGTVRVPEMAAGMQCVAYYGRGGINVSAERMRRDS